MRDYINVIEKHVYRPKDSHPLEMVVARLKDSAAAPYIRVIKSESLPTSLEIFIDLNHMKLPSQEKEEAIREILSISKEFYGSLEPYVLNTKRSKSVDGKPVFKQALWKKNSKASGWVAVDKKNDIITKGRAGTDLGNYNIDVAGLFEDAISDHSFQSEAQHIAKEVGVWLAKANEEAPLKDVATRFARGNEEIYAINAKVAGDQYDDLYIGFTKGEPNEGYMAITKTSPRKYFVVANVNNDPANITDVIYSIKWSVLIHEITHYLDRKRSNTVPDGRHKDSAEQYYNSPMEYNAYFQEGFYRILNDVERNSSILNDISFGAFMEKFRGHFNLEWLYYMTDDTKKRFRKRMYGLYRMLTME